MINYLKKLYLQDWQNFSYYISIFRSEYGKVGSFSNEVIGVTTLLAVNGYKLGWWIVPIFIGAMVVFFLIGYGLDKLKVPQYNSRLTNQRNPEFLEMKEDIKRILELLEHAKKD